MDYSNFINLIPPALIFSILAYLSRFFGKIISDQRPFTDDRGWEIELSGFVYVVNLVFSGIVGIGVAIKWPILISSWVGQLVVLLIVSAIGGIIIFTNSVMGAKLYKIEQKIFKDDEEFDKKLKEFFIKIGERMPISVILILLFYLLTLSYLSWSLFWFIAILCEVLIIFISTALNFSLKRFKPQEASIFFINQSIKPLKNISLLKVNSDNVRIRKENQVIIINKEYILRIEIDVSKK